MVRPSAPLSSSLPTFVLRLVAAALLLLARPAAAQDTTAVPDTSAASDNTVAPSRSTTSVRSDLITATDLFKVRDLSEVTVSPDGRNVVYAVKSIVEKPDSAGQYAYRTHLHLAPASGRDAPRPLTRGTESASSPAWHPSGDWLAFVRAVEGTPQVFALSLLGGEPVQLTDAEHGATDPHFSPDGEALLFASELPPKAVREITGGGPVWPDERPGRAPGDTAQAADPDGSLAQVRAWLDRNQDDRSPRVLTRLDFQGEFDLESDPTYRHLFVQPVRAGLDLEPAGEARAVTSGFFSHGGGAWMPGSRQVVVSRAPVEDEHPDRVRQSDLYLASTDSSSPGGLVPLVQMEGYALTDPAVSPRGTAVAFLASSLEDPGYAQSEIGLFPLDGAGRAELLTLDFDRSTSPPKWSPDGWFLYTTAPSEGGFPLYRLAPFARTASRADFSGAAPPDSAAMPAADTTQVPTDSSMLALMDTSQALADSAAAPAVERLTAITRGIRSFDAGRGSVFYVVTEPSNPYELYANTAEFTRERRLSAHNAAWLEGKRLSTPEPFYVRRDTLMIQGWTMRPPDLEDGRAAPLLVEMHGGPAAMWGPGEATMWHEFQYLAAQGFALVFSNPRGSGGYGHAFKAANYQDWGTGPMGDVLAAADEAAALPWTDASRQVLTGGSYAGYLTAWIVAHTDRFRAAVAQRGVYDLPTFLGEGNAWRLVPWHFGGYPWDRQAPPAGSPTATPGDVDPLPEPRPDDNLAFDADRFFRREAADSTSADSAAIDSAAAGARVLAAADTARVDTSVGARPPRFASPREALIQNSPITFVDQIRTPLLIMHADNDLRTGVSQSEMLYRSLKVLRRPVEYVRYPNAGHDLSRTGDPRQRLDRVLRIREFFARYLGEEAVSVRQ